MHQQEKINRRGIPLHLKQHTFITATKINFDKRNNLVN